MNYFLRYIFTILTLCLVLLFSGCAKTSINEIPSYIAIDSLSLNVSDIQGSASHKITDTWIYADNDLIGAFAFPFPLKRIPLLKSGSCQLSIFAGIKLNGINETRTPYPFYQPLNKTVTLEREKVLDLGEMKFSYVTGTKFAWIENFEKANLSIDSTARSEVNLVRTLLPELATVFPNEVNKYAAKVVIPNDSLVFECCSHDSFKLPTTGSSVFLELNYKTNNKFTVGFFINGAVTSQRPILVVNPSLTWNKIYINLTPTLSANSDATSFRVFFSAVKSTSDPEAEIYFDNIKLLHF
ncbi:MAG: hypothetical protein WCR72_11400 [Bacteroidota bacterium]